MRLAITAAAVAAALLLLAARPSDAAAGPLSCGATITRDTTLHADLSCAGTALRIGADRVALDLDGHVVESVCTEADCSASIGIDNSGGYDRVRITDGSVRGVQYGILLVDAGRNRLLRLDVSGGGYERAASSAIRLEESNRNRVAGSDLDGGDPGLQLSGSSRNVIVHNSIAAGIDIHNGDGVRIEDGSSRNRIEDNEISGLWLGVVAAGSNRNLIASNDVSAYADALVVGRSARTRIADNELDSSQGRSIYATAVTRSEIVANGDGAILIDGDRNVVARNRASGGPFASVALEVAGGERNVIRRNLARYGYLDAEILVRAAATRALLAGNTATGAPQSEPIADADGIRVEAAGTIIRRNRAIDNADLGIDAVPGVIDGGGNRAGGNLNPLQCVNVVCGPIG